MKAARVASAKRYFLPGRIEVWQNRESVLRHDYSARNRDVVIQFPVGTLAGSVGWFLYAAKFQERHRCRHSCAMCGKLIPLIRNAYADIEFVTQAEVKTERSLGLFFDHKANVLQPCDFRQVGPHSTAGYILARRRPDGSPSATRHSERRRASDGGALCLHRDPEARPNTGTTRTAGARSSKS
jgi:autotransporter strand-loop-strand O-heptosyltransferase